MRQNHTSSSKSTKSKRGEPALTEAPDSTIQPVAKQGSEVAATPAGGRRGFAVAERVDEAKRRARYDRPGHLADAHASRLLHLSKNRAARDEFAMVFDSAASDDLATELGEQAVSSMVGGGETWLDMVDAPIDEDEGGPFVETRGVSEFAADLESERGTEGFLREALPTPSAGPSVPFGRVRGRLRT